VKVDDFAGSGGPSTGPTRSAPGHVVSNLCFCIPYDLEVTQRVLLHPGCETLKDYVSCLGGPGAGPTRNAPGHVTLNLWLFISYDLEVM
jgi:hypothetical protein